MQFEIHTGLEYIQPQRNEKLKKAYGNLNFNTIRHCQWFKGHSTSLQSEIDTVLVETHLYCNQI